MKIFAVQLITLLLSLVTAAPVRELASRAEGLPRLVIYFQTTHDSSGSPISMLPLITEQGIALTHLIVCSFHISANSDIHLNDFPPGHEHFATLWEETKVMKDAGVKVMGMVGGAAPGSYEPETLDSTDDATFEKYYGQLANTIRDFGLQGMDLDVEQHMSQAGINRLITRLQLDFGSDFIITMAPVASALQGGGNLSGFDYQAIRESAAGPHVDFYNAQFYNGWGSMATPDEYEDTIAHGWSPSKVVAGQVTNPRNGWQYNDFPTLNETVSTLMSEYGTFGGIMGWEYFNSMPGNTAKPWQWAQEMTEILRPGLTPSIAMTDEQADRLEAAYHTSHKSAGASVATVESHNQIGRKVNYKSMVNMQ